MRLLWVFLTSSLFALPIVSIKHTENGGVGYETGYTTVKVLCQEPSWFFDARGHLLDNGFWAGNVGVGRRVYTEGIWLGGNLYYDMRQVLHRGWASQVGIGFEAFTSALDFRCNFYQSICSRVQFDTTRWDYVGDYYIRRDGYFIALRGLDTEVGFWRQRYPLGEFYAAAGLYFLHGPVAQNAYGAKLRCQARVTRFLLLEATLTNDTLFHSRLQGSVTIDIPFGGEGTLPMPVQRNEIIPVVEQDLWDWNY